MSFHCVGLMPSILSVRLDLATSAALTAAAVAADVSVSGFARAAIMRSLPDGATLPALPPSPARRRPRVPDDDVAAVARLTGEVGRLTGATIQLARSLREGGRAPEHETTESILRDLRTTQSDLVHIVDRLRAAEAIE